MIPLASIRFPRLNGNWEKASEADRRYNCIAWAAEDSDHWWEPIRLGGFTWPEGVPMEHTLAAYKGAFEAIGYEACSSGDLEQGYGKVALFADSLGFPTHAARQLPDGRWTSKLGKLVDIIHTSVDDVGGGLYGEVVAFLRRARREVPTDS